MASSFGPTLLVNTEAFAVIDDTDSTANVVIKFGDTLAKTITYNRTAVRFEFNDSVSVTGNVRVTGTASGRNLFATSSMTGANIYASSTFAGANLSDCDTGATSKLLWSSESKNFSCGTDQGGAGSGISQTDADARYVKKQGDTMTGSLKVRANLSGTTLRTDGNADIWGTLSATGTIKTKADLGINADNDTNDATLTFGNQTAAQTLKFIHSRQLFHFSTDINVSGTASGRVVHAQNRLESSGSLLVTGNGKFGGGTLFIDSTNNKVGVKNLAPETELEVAGTMSGTALTAGSLKNCDTIDTNINGVFTCGTDAGGGGGTPGGSDMHVQYNDGGSTFGGETQFRWNKTTDVLTVAGTASGRLIHAQNRLESSGSLVVRSNSVLSGTVLLINRGEPRVPGSGSTAVYSGLWSGRSMLTAKPPLYQAGSGFALQPGLFTRQIVHITPSGASTLNVLGTGLTTVGTISSPAPTEALGYNANIVTPTANGTGGIISTVTQWFRGSTPGHNGFFFKARLSPVEITNVKYYCGLTDQATMTIALRSDNPAGNRVGFGFSTVRGDTALQFSTKDNTTQNLINTGMTFTAGQVYNIYFYTPPYSLTNKSVMYWRVDNLTLGSTAEGSTAANLPAGSTALRLACGLVSTLTPAKNMRLGFIYVETGK